MIILPYLLMSLPLVWPEHQQAWCRNCKSEKVTVSIWRCSLISTWIFISKIDVLMRNRKPRKPCIYIKTDERFLSSLQSGQISTACTEKSSVLFSYCRSGGSFAQSGTVIHVVCQIKCYCINALSHYIPSWMTTVDVTYNYLWTGTPDMHQTPIIQPGIVIFCKCPGFK